MITALALAIFVQSPPVTQADVAPIVVIDTSGAPSRRVVVVIDGEPYTVWTYTRGTGPTPGPGPGPVPPPTPTPDLGLRPIVAALAGSLDPATRSSVAKVYRDVAASARAGQYADTGKMRDAHIAAIRAATGQNYTAYSLAFTAVAERLKALTESGKLKSVTDWAGAWEEIAAGLTP